MLIAPIICAPRSQGPQDLPRVPPPQSRLLTSVNYALKGILRLPLQPSSIEPDAWYIIDIRVFRPLPVCSLLWFLSLLISIYIFLAFRGMRGSLEDTSGRLRNCQSSQEKHIQQSVITITLQLICAIDYYKERSENTHEWIKIMILFTTVPTFRSLEKFVPSHSGFPPFQNRSTTLTNRLTASLNPENAWDTLL